jgi:hypothetical protein
MIKDDFEEEDLSREEERELKKGKDKIDGRKLTGRIPARLRSLRQYQNMSDEEFEEKMALLNAGVKTNQEFEKRIQHKIKEFEVDYDLSELNSNDKLVLRALCQAHITLEDLETQSYNIRSQGIDFDNLTIIEKMSKVMSDLRKDISQLQGDLLITRKVRKNDKETSVINFLEDLKIKAKEFYSAKMQYLFCPSCNLLLGTLWTLFPQNPHNKITLVCERELENGEKCGTKLVVTTKELWEKRQSSNKPETMPESML